MNLDGLDRQLFDIRNRINQDLSNEIKKLQALMTDTNAAEIQRQIDGITAASRAALEAQEELARRTFEQQRSFSEGWRKAFNEYRDNATNAARQAQRIFSTVTRSMEDSIVNFAKTGKFQFRDFANVVLEELLRIQIQRTFANIFSGGSSGGGGSILGSLFGGFFATGGQIPPGRFGVVGESGPELVQGPADVTPLTGTTVTYNINAVDASSFKQLLARDPGYLYAVTQQGAKGLPGRR
jgi:lambda family phage tail tape measure protein